MLHIEEEAARCLLCADAPCSKACKTGDPARAIRAIRFGNDSRLYWPSEDVPVYADFAYFQLYNTTYTNVVIR